MSFIDDISAILKYLSAPSQQHFLTYEGNPYDPAAHGGCCRIKAVPYSGHNDHPVQNLLIYRI